jgi:hypothetical protein
MPESQMRFVRRSAEFIEKSDISRIKSGLRGIYVLYQQRDKPRSKRKAYDVQYIGMAAGKVGFKSRLRSHRRSKTKRDAWTHFSIFEVWDNVSDREIAELEGVARHFYRRDMTASTLNIQRGYRKLKKIRNQKLEEW